MKAQKLTIINTKKEKFYDILIEKLERKESVRFKYITCPFFINNKCSIYDKRYNCCRNFPNKNGICADYDCGLIDNTSNYEVCKNCRAKCCTKIMYPAEKELDIDLVIDLLNMDCETCIRLFSDYWPYDYE